MLKITPPNKLVFKQKQKSKNLTLYNQSGQLIIYKIKANNLQVVQAKPTCGFIEGNTSLSLLIRVFKNTPFQVKLQINYSISHGGAIDSFAEKWSALDRKDLKQHLICVQKVVEQQNNQIMGLRQIPEQQIQKGDQFRSLVNPMKNSQEELLLTQQKNRVLKLKQELQITERKLKEITDNELQMKINRSIGGVCQQHHTSLTTLLIIGLFCLVMGFMLGKAG